MYIQQTIKWIQSFVIELNLCPFAKHEMDNDTARILVSPSTTFEDGLIDFMTEIEYLNSNPTVGTTLLLFPHFLDDFIDYLDFVDFTEEALVNTQHLGIYQIATFHPAYCFHGTRVDDVSNYTNRSPYPMLHILREEMLDRAIAYYGDTESIPANNIACLKKLGLTDVKTRLQNCIK
jgi:hypothetical protein